MLIDIDRASRQGYARYLINRPDDSYTILEGSASLFDTYASKLIEINSHNPEFKPYFRTLLSFKEEDLTLEDLMDVYQSFKEKFFKNYDPEEYNLFSVVHWDDNKPHIHVGIIANSLINNKDLRVMRGYLDVPRVDSIAELINYEYGFESVKESIPVLTLTSQQKIRDWKVKKGNPSYEVEDDRIHNYISECARLSDNYDDFINKLKDKYPKMEIHSKEFETVGTGKIKEEILVLNESGVKVDNFIYKSFLFNETWFNKNIDNLKKYKNIKDFRTSIKREDKNYYLKQFERMSKHHANDLEKRNIHEGLVEHKLRNYQLNLETDNILSNLDLRDISTANIYSLREYDLGTIKGKRDFVKKFIEFTRNLNTRDELALVLKLINGELYEKGVGVDSVKYISLLIDGTVPVIIEDEHLYKIFNRKLDDFIKEEWGEQYNSGSSRKSLKEILDFYSTNKRKELAMIKKHILNYVFENINNRTELELSFKKSGIEILKRGEDYKRGEYLTIKYKNKILNLYSKMLLNMYDIDGIMELEENKKIPNNLLLSYTSPFTHGYIKPESLQEFRLKKQNYIDCRIAALDKDDKQVTLFNNKTKARDRNKTYQTQKLTKKYLNVEKCIDIDKFIVDLLIELKSKQCEKIEMRGNYEFQDQVINSLKEISKSPNFKNYMNKLKINSSNYINLINIKNGNIYPANNKNNTEAEQKSDYNKINRNNNENLTELEKIITRIQKVNDAIVKTNTNKSVKNYKNILIAAARTEDKTFFEQIVSNMGYHYKNKNKNVEFINTEKNKKIITDNVDILKIIGKDKSFPFLDKLSKAELEDIYTSKNSVLNRLYQHEYEDHPVLNIQYNLQGGNDYEMEKSSSILYKQKEAIISFNGNNITVHKTKDIQKSEEYVQRIADVHNRKLESSESEEIEKKLNVTHTKNNII